MKTDRKAQRTTANSLSQAHLMSCRLEGRQQNGSELKQTSFTAVMTALESLLQQKWADLLNVSAPSIRPNDDFFTLGGNSIRAMRLVAALKTSGYLISVADTFKSPTLTEMALKTCPLIIHRNAPTPRSAAVIEPRDIPRLGFLSKTRTWLDTSNIEGVAPATDLQALMLSEGHVPEGGCMVATICVEPHTGRQQQSLNLTRLREACEQVIRHHSILRTVFIQNQQSLLQVTLRSPPVKQIHMLQAGESSKHRVSVALNILNILPHFDLISDDSGAVCLGLKVTIHHAHYDAISLGHLLEDLKNTYCGNEILARQPSFHEWSSHVANAERIVESQGFWRELLKGSISYPLAPSGSTKQRRPVSHTQKHYASIQVPVTNLLSPNGTTATVLKAA